MGDTGAHSKDLAVATENELSDIARQTSANKDAVISQLLQSVTTVGGA